MLKKLATFLTEKKVKDINFTLRANSDEQVTVMVQLKFDSESKLNVNPFVASGTPEEIEEVFLVELANRFNETHKGLINNISVIESQLKKKETETKDKATNKNKKSTTSKPASKVEDVKAEEESENLTLEL